MPRMDPLLLIELQNTHKLMLLLLMLFPNFHNLGHLKNDKYIFVKLMSPSRLVCQKKEGHQSLLEKTVINLPVTKIARTFTLISI